MNDNVSTSLTLSIPGVGCALLKHSGQVTEDDSTSFINTKKGVVKAERQNRWQKYRSDNLALPFFLKIMPVRPTDQPTDGNKAALPKT